MTCPFCVWNIINKKCVKVHNMKASTTIIPVEYTRNKTFCMVTGVFSKFVLQTLYKREI